MKFYMNNYQFIKKYQRLEKDFTVKEIKQIDWASLVFCGDSDNAFWNWAIFQENPSRELLVEIDREFNKRNKQYSLVLEDSQLADLGADLTKNGFKLIDQQDWMILKESGQSFDLTMADFLIVKNKQEIDLFVEVFNQVFINDDPINPFGNPGEIYLNVLKRGLNSLARAQGLIIFNSQREPVAVSMLLSYNKMGYLSNIGVIPKFRGQGFGRIATLAALSCSQKEGNNLHTLKILKDFGLDEFYAKFGFNLFSRNTFLSKF